MTLEECKTAEDVEKIACNDCANEHHWGWCDMAHIKCIYRDKIKEILGIPTNQYSKQFTVKENKE